MKSLTAWLVFLLLLLIGIAIKAEQQSATGMNYVPVMSATTGAIGGSLLLAGACSTGTVAVAGAVPGQPVAVSASDGTNLAALGAYIHGDVTSGGTVTVSVCAIISLTPASKTYNVRVIP